MLELLDSDAGKISRIVSLFPSKVCSCVGHTIIIRLWCNAHRRSERRWLLPQFNCVGSRNQPMPLFQRNFTIWRTQSALTRYRFPLLSSRCGDWRSDWFGRKPSLLPTLWLTQTPWWKICNKKKRMKTLNLWKIWCAILRCLAPRRTGGQLCGRKWKLWKHTQSFGLCLYCVSLNIWADKYSQQSFFIKFSFRLKPRH